MFRAIAAVVGLLSHSCTNTTFASELIEGDDCQLVGSTTIGTCKLLSHCNEAIKELQQGQAPSHCGWIGGIEVVCCPKPPPKIIVERPAPSRVSAQMCFKYNEAAYEKVFGLGCQLQLPIDYGGALALTRQFPHMARLGYDRPLSDDLLFLCSGSLISDRIILTASHCITSHLVGPPRVIQLGSDRSVLNISVEEVYVPPKYEKLDRYDDIGLIRMKRSVEFSRFIRPACLADTVDTATKYAIATECDRRNDILKKNVLELFSDSDCRELYPMETGNTTFKNGIIPQTQFCAGYRKSLKDDCKKSHSGSGGPNQIFHPHNTCSYSLIGVSSFSQNCGNETVNGFSTVFTRVSAYLDWIESIVWPEVSPNGELK